MDIFIKSPDPALIPSFTPGAAYVIDVSWSFLEEQLDHYRDDYGLDLDPDFQRVHVWDERRRRRYVEFILRGGESARELRFNSIGWMGHGDLHPIVIVDGKQRLEAVRRFMANGLEVFGGWKLSDFKEPRRLLRHHLAGFKFHINDLATRAEVLQWYLDINSGGVAHTDEEIARVQRLLEEEKGLV